MAGPVHEIFVVAIVARKLRQLTFKETIFKVIKKKKFQSTPLNKNLQGKLTNCRKVSAV